VWYILKLMGKAPKAGEYGIKDSDIGPIRTAGITPGPTQNPLGDEPLPTPKPSEQEPV
jgi:cytochrome d ubiquinol oxidase subunit I